MKYNPITAQSNYTNSDEHYTKREAIVPLIKHLPKDKIYWLPTDTEQSNFVKVFSENLLQVTHSHISTGQDFFNYEPKEWDILITNPPFTNKKAFVERAISFNKPFALLLPLTWLNDTAPFRLFKDIGLQLLIFDRRTEFINARANRISFKCGYYARDLFKRDIIFECLGDSLFYGKD